MSEKLTEVVIRNPKRPLGESVSRFLASLAVLAAIPAILILAIPVAAGLFGVEAHPNYGEALLLLLTVRFLSRVGSIEVLQPWEKKIN